MAVITTLEKYSINFRYFCKETRHKNLI